MTHLLRAALAFLMCLFQVPEFLLTGLKNARLGNERQAGKTQDKIAIRLDRIAREHVDFGPYADSVMDVMLAPMSARVRELILHNLVS